MPEKDSEIVPTKRNAPLWIKVWLPLHIIAITAWSLPYAPAAYRGSPEKLKIKGDTFIAKVQSGAEVARNGFLYANERYVKDSPLKQYLLFTGFWQYWDMFSPNPASVDNYATIYVNYADKTRKKYPYPRIYELPLHQKFMKERWRKFFERAGTGEYNYLWKPLGLAVAADMFDDPNNPPVSVELHRHQLVIAPPGEKQETEYSDELFYTVYVDRAELKRRKGF